MNPYLRNLRQHIGHDLIMMPGTRIIMENEHGHILLQLRSDFELWGLPAGSPDVGETLSDCIRREVFEETGLTLLELHVFGVASHPDYETIEYPNGDRIQNYSTMFYSRRWQGKLDADNDETLDLQFFAPDTLPDMIPNHRRAIDLYLKFKQTGQFWVD